MIKNYLKIAFRILNRNKVFSIINISGLSIALTSVLVIFLFVTNELNFDKYNSKYDKIYRVVQKEIGNDGRERFEEALPVPFGNAIKSNITGCQDVTLFFYNSEQLLRVNSDKYNEKGLVYADTNFVKVFDVEFITGNPDQIRNPNIIFLSEKLAIKYFGSIENAMNKEIIMLDSIGLSVQGVIKDLPKNTHIPYTAIISWGSLTAELLNFEYDNWGTTLTGFAIYLTLMDGVSEKSVEQQIKKIYTTDNINDNRDHHVSFFLQPLSKIHIDDRFDAYSGSYITSLKFIWIFISVGLFILVIASINYINLSVVQIIKRAKEVGIRKVLGASRQILIKQFLGETLLLLFIAEIISLILTEVVIDKINKILGNSIELKLYSDFSIILFLIVVIVLLSFLSGIYPAVILSKYNPIRALRYRIKIGKKKALSLHNLLVILQFSISMVLIVCTVIISLQLDYFQNKDLGFTKENIILLDLPQNQVKKAGTLTEILKTNPDILDVAMGLGAPISNSNINSSFYKLGEEDIGNHANVKTVDTSYYRIYNLKLLAGEWYKKANVNDSVFNIVVNESLLKKINISNPEDAIDQYLYIFGSVQGRITGVVEDFHTYSLKYNIPPVIFIGLDDYFYKLSIKTNGKSYNELKSFLEDAWDQVFPEYIYSYQYLNGLINENYSTEQRTSDIIKIFTFIAIVIACLGLYGLVSFMLMQRTKEIGIRKVLGASVPHIILKLSSEFIKWVLIANVIGWPIAWFITNKWLQNFAYRINLSVWMFVLSGSIALIIALLTVSWQSIRAATANPVESLRCE